MAEHRRPVPFGMPATRAVAVLLAALAAWSPAQAISQPANPPAGQPAPAAGSQAMQLDQLPPPIRLGARVRTIRQAAPVVPVVVLVPTPQAYLEALSAWHPTARFPILIDDGTPAAREQIGRFVRAFEPTRVVVPTLSAEPWRGDRATRIDRLVATHRRALGLRPIDDPLPEMATSPVVAPGIVVADPDDPAWPAAVALAAGWAQPLVFVEGFKQNLSGTMTSDEVDLLASEVALAAQQTGLSWDALGDQLDAIALCLNTPVKFTAFDGTQEQVLAVTDRLGRTAGATRWAWASQVPGAHRDAAYRAMCSLFLPPTRAWLFDGYPTQGEPWTTWDLTSAAPVLERMGLAPRVMDGRGAGVRDWRLAASRPLDADLVIVNTRGNAPWFELNPGRAWMGDIPMLERPAAVHFTHSWSASRAGQRETIAGRWLDRGAFAYVGSVSEPFLHAFIPGPILTNRFAASYPWAAAPRHDGPVQGIGDVWKIAVMGDPLFTPGDPGRRIDQPLPFDALDDLAAQAAEAVRSRAFERAIDLLVRLGRDGDAARLVTAIVEQQPDALTPALAEASIPAVFRAGSVGTLETLYRALPPERQADAELRDYLWLALRPVLEASSGTEFTTRLSLLLSNIRDDQRPSDAFDLAVAAQRADAGVNPLSILDRIEPRNRGEASDLQRFRDQLIGR